MLIYGRIVRCVGIRKEGMVEEECRSVVRGGYYC